MCIIDRVSDRAAVDWAAVNKLQSQACVSDNNNTKARGSSQKGRNLSLCGRKSFCVSLLKAVQFKHWW